MISENERGIRLCPAPMESSLGGSCWVFQGDIAPSGYGSVHIGTHGAFAHRVAWILLRGPIPRQTEIHHLCKVRRCINPDHMQLVTRKEHMRIEGYALQTHCIHGHLFDESNTYIRRDGHGGRMCRACDRERQRRKYHAKRQVA